MYVIICASRDKGPGVVIKAASLESRRSWVRPPPRSGIQVAKKQNVSPSLLIGKYSILWDASVNMR